MTETIPNARARRLETMMLIRAYEEQAVELQSNGAPGTCTSVGQEAAAVGVVDALEKRDRILTNHRSAGHLLARGADPNRLLAEVLGRVDGYCGGRSGSLHISAKELGVVLTSTIVGGELSLAPGVALAQKMGHGEPGGITAVFFGDGAACEGIFHEALNLAVQQQGVRALEIPDGSPLPESRRGGPRECCDKKRPVPAVTARALYSWPQW